MKYTYQNNNAVNFQAKFVKSQSLYDIVEYAVSKGKFDKLNKSRKAVDALKQQTKLKVDLLYEDDCPAIVFSRFEPKKGVRIAHSAQDYELTAVSEFVASRPQNILKFALEKMLKLGNNSADNKMFKQVVIDKQKNIPNFSFLI